MIGRASSVTPATVPGAPTGLSATAGDQEVDLSWTAPASNGGAAITDYEYELNGSGAWTSTGGTAPSYTVRNLTNGQPYTFKVRAVNRDGPERHGRRPKGGSELDGAHVERRGDDPALRIRAGRVRDLDLHGRDGPQLHGGCFRHQLLLPSPYLVLTKPLRLDIQCQRGASVKIGWKYLDD